jgi:dihydroorotate dehydrogenase
MFKLIIRPLLFKLSPERAHYLTAFLLHSFMLIPGVIWLLRKMYLVQNEQLRINKKGLSFPNPVGLAAGFDKNAKLYKDFQHLGFGFIEVGTVTPKAQDGNPKPRLHPTASGMLNAVGLQGPGVEVWIARDLPQLNDIGATVVCRAPYACSGACGREWK